jgi:hypothetical protein
MFGFNQNRKNLKINSDYDPRNRTINRILRKGKIFDKEKLIKWLFYSVENLMFFKRTIELWGYARGLYYILLRVACYPI